MGTNALYVSILNLSATEGEKSDIGDDDKSRYRDVLLVHVTAGHVAYARLRVSAL